MEPVDTHYAKARLSRLLERVAQGEEVIIVRNGEPLAKLVRFVAPDRVPGSLKGRIEITEDFDEPLPDDLLAAFAGAGAG